MEPSFRSPIQEAVVNYKTQQNFYLTSLDSHFEDSQSTLEQIVAICNLPEIYHFLFARRLKGASYPLESAQSFVRWAKQGWSNRKWFVFLILTTDNHVAGAIDIRGNDLDGSEVGYWLSSEYSGVMTNTVTTVLSIAQQAGYKRLFAWVDPANGKSSRVLERAGFINIGLMLHEERKLIRYEVTLESN